eukprot:sb/3463992/
MNKKTQSITRKRMLYMYNAIDNTHSCISCLEPEDRCDVATASIDSSRQWYQMLCLGPKMPYKRVRSFASNSWDLYSDDNQNIQYQNPSQQAQLMQKRLPYVHYTESLTRPKNKRNLFGTPVAFFRYLALYGKRTHFLHSFSLPLFYFYSEEGCFSRSAKYRKKATGVPNKFLLFFATASIDSSRQWYQMLCLGPKMPYKRVRSFASNSWDLYSDDNQNIQYQNPSQQAQLMQKRLPYVHYTETEYDRNSKMYFASRKVFPLYYVMYLNILKYPLLIIINPYPDGNMATKKWELGLPQWLATDKDCVTITMDLKGTPGRDLSFHHYPYKRMERVIDQLESGIWDIRRYWHVNDNKVAIMGHGIGGWAALKISSRKPDWFKAVIAVDPILDFKKYASAYSERYFELVKINPNAYSNAMVNLTTTAYPTELRSKTLIYFDPANPASPYTYSAISAYLADNKTLADYVDFSGFRLVNISAIEDKAETGILYVDIGKNLTAELEQDPHDIF